MLRLPRPLLFVALMGIPLAVCAQVYQWTDSHGTVHYSDSPPPQGVHYKAMKIAGSAGPVVQDRPSTGPADATAETHTTTNDDRRQAATDTPSNRKKLCDTLHANIALLEQSSRPVIYKDDKGKQQVMSQDRRKQELDKQQGQYRQFCQK